MFPQIKQEPGSRPMIVYKCIVFRRRSTVSDQYPGSSVSGFRFQLPSSGRQSAVSGSAFSGSGCRSQVLRCWFPADCRRSAVSVGGFSSPAAGFRVFRSPAASCRAAAGSLRFCVFVPPSPVSYMQTRGCAAASFRFLFMILYF